jgi:hypothetical protein
VELDPGGIYAPTATNRKRTGTPRSHQRTWVENGFFETLSLEGQPNLCPDIKALVGLAPNFLFRQVASAHFMRFSLKKTAHSVVSSAAYRKAGSPIVFVPGTLVRTWGTRPVSLNVTGVSNYAG